eukprot:6442298-Lingulodinium_polyedra.AAC.1
MASSEHASEWQDPMVTVVVGWAVLEKWLDATGNVRLPNLQLDTRKAYTSWLVEKVSEDYYSQ